MKTLAIAPTIALLLTLTACDDGAKSPRTGRKLIDVPLVALDGTSTTLADLTKDRVVLLEFGTTRCPWCTRQLEDFEKAIEAYGDSLLVLEIDIAEPAGLVEAYYARHKFATTVVLDPSGEAAAAYGVRAIPFTLIVDHNGVILYDGAYTPFATLKPILDQAIAKAPSPAGRASPASPLSCSSSSSIFGCLAGRQGRRTR